jgi:hypothetical protein
MIDNLKPEDARKLYQFTRRLRDKLAIEINNGTTRDPGEFNAVCELLNRVKDAFHEQDRLPPGVMVDRRRTPRLN